MLRRLFLTAVVLLAAAPAWALEATYRWTLPTDASRTAVRVERRDGPDTAAWVAQGQLLAPDATSFSQSGLVLGARVCYRAVTVNPIADGDPGAESCATPDKPMSAGGGTLLITK